MSIITELIGEIRDLQNPEPKPAFLMKRSQFRERVYAMLRKDMSVKDIAELTGKTVGAIYYHKQIWLANAAEQALYRIEQQKRELDSGSPPLEPTPAATPKLKPILEHLGIKYKAK